MTTTLVHIVSKLFSSTFSKWGIKKQRTNSHDGSALDRHRTVEVLRHSLGPEHPETLNAEVDLAIELKELERYQDAERLEIHVMESRERLLAPEHPNTLSVQANLAFTYTKLGRYLDAEKLMVKVMETKERVLGPEHLETLSVQAHLAFTYTMLGRYLDAEKLVVGVLETRERLLGPEHPKTLNVQAHLAFTYTNLGRYLDAEKLMVKVMETKERLLGPEHPETLNAEVDLAFTYIKLGRYSDAEKLMVKVMETKAHLLGSEHPETLNAEVDLAIQLKELDRYQEAERLEVHVMESRERLLGPDHPKTVSVQAHLAFTYTKLGRYLDAEKLLVKVMETRLSLAIVNEMLGRYDDAKRLGVQVMTTRERLLGPLHPETLNAQESLATTYEAMGRYREAETLRMQVLDVKSSKLKTSSKSQIRQKVTPDGPYLSQGLSNLSHGSLSYGNTRASPTVAQQYMKLNPKALIHDQPTHFPTVSNLCLDGRITQRSEHSGAGGGYAESSNSRIRKKVTTDGPYLSQGLSNLSHGSYMKLNPKALIHDQPTPFRTVSNLCLDGPITQRSEHSVAGGGYAESSNSRIRKKVTTDGPYLSQGLSNPSLGSLSYGNTRASPTVAQQYMKLNPKALIHDQTTPFPKASNLCLDGRITQRSKHSVAGGGYADIWTGKLGDTKVAIKILRRFSSEGVKIRHDKLMRLPALISPWMSHGTLLSYIASNPKNDRIHLILDYLGGSLRWMAPELLHNGKPSRQSDVWAFGMTMLVR
ncbi:hypothetical protein BU17DRAFT_67010 [Hysterangium stoloniferum]|nr:hypothetical protein BU17DRAFT_67010 [Hysterangium stoloniferum]